jgi:hypothetical protein
MRIITVAAVVVLFVASLAAQEKPVPKDSMRVTVNGCTKGNVFTAGARTEDQIGRADIPEGMHLRMNGQKKLMTDIKVHEGQVVRITGLMKKGQYNQQGIPVGGGVRVTPGVGNGGIGARVSPGTDAVGYIDVESWQPAEGSCPSR